MRKNKLFAVMFSIAVVSGHVLAKDMGDHGFTGSQFDKIEFEGQGIRGLSAVGMDFGGNRPPVAANIEYRTDGTAGNSPFRVKPRSVADIKKSASRRGNIAGLGTGAVATAGTFLALNYAAKMIVPALIRSPAVCVNPVPAIMGMAGLVAIPVVAGMVGLGTGLTTRYIVKKSYLNNNLEQK
ncbi:hypothetical protein ACFL6Y_08345 [Elusimicrobiota bacterium]